MKMAVFWVVAPCGMVKFTDVSEVLAASIMKATVINFYQTTRRNNPEERHFHNRRHENLKSHLENIMSSHKTTVFKDQC
jgi:hypothetical protein